MDERQRALILDTIQEHHERIANPVRTEVVAGSPVPFSGPVRTVGDADGNPTAVVIARPTWWDNDDEVEGLLTIAGMAGVPLWRIRYDAETLEPVGEPERIG